MSLRGLAVAACMASACTSIPEFAPANGVTWEGVGESGTVRLGSGASAVTLHFHGGGAVPFPDTFTYGGQELIGTQPQESCANEDGVGIAVYPGPRISPSGQATITSTSLVANMKGPAVVQIEATWGAAIDCSGTTIFPYGRSVYSVFPDGHVVRYDDITETEHPSVMAQACRCNAAQTANDFYLTSFWTFQQRAGAVYNQTGMIMQLPAAVGSLGQASELCFTSTGTTPSFEVAYASKAAGSRGELPATNQTLAFVSDFAQASPQLGAVQFQATSILAVGPNEGCTQGRAFVRSFIDSITTSSNLRIDGGMAHPGAKDGIYGGDDADGAGPRKIQITNGSLELSAVGPVPPYFAVWVQFKDDVGAIQVKRDFSGGEGRSWYIPQRINDREFIVWFADGLDLNQHFTIEGVE